METKGSNITVISINNSNTQPPGGDEVTQPPGGNEMNEVIVLPFPLPDNFRNLVPRHSKSMCKDVVMQLLNAPYNFTLDDVITEFQCLCVNQTEVCGVGLAGELGDRRTRYWLFPENEKGVYNVQVIITTLVAIIGLLGIVGNLLVIITIFGWMPKDNVTYIFIANLSIADFMVIIGCLPLKTHEYLYDHWNFDYELCLFVTHLFYTSLALSVYTQTAMAMERYLVICYPMKAQVISTSSRARSICGLLWILALSVAILPTYMITVVERNLGGYIEFCHVPAIHYKNNALAQMLYLDVVIFFIPTCFMTFAYVSIGKTLYISIKESSQLSGTEGESSASDKKTNAAKEKASTARNRIKVIRLLVIVLVVFLVCWLPYIIYETINVFDNRFFNENLTFTSDKDSGSDRFYRVAFKFSLMLLTFFNSCVNPVLYAFLSEQFRKGMKQVVTCGDRLSRLRSASSAATTSRTMLTSISSSTVSST